MTKKLRRSLLTILGIALAFLVVLIASNIIIKNKITRFTQERLPAHISATYANVSLHLLNGTLTYSDVEVHLQNTSNDTAHTFLAAKKVIVEDVSYWDYITKNEIHIEDIKIKSPHIKYYKNRLISSRDTSKRKAFISLNKPLIVDELSIDNAYITFFDKTDKDTLLYVKDITVEIDDILVNNSTLQKRLPITFKNYEAEADSIFLKVSAFENLTVGDFKLKNETAVVTNLHFATKYSKAAHASQLQTERDHFDISLQKIQVDDITFGFVNRKFFATSSFVNFDAIKATIYRNKLVADDPTIKPLYSKLLRDLPIDLNIDSMAIKNSALTYQEKVKADQPPGTIYFDGFTANITHVGNRYPKGTATKIAVDTRFMKAAPLHVDWSFQVDQPQDNFTLQASLGALAAEKMNAFTKPNLTIELEGEAEKTYFSIYGNSAQSTIDMRMEYKDFKVNLMRKDGKKKNKLLSGIVNIFVNKDSGDDDSHFSKGSASVTPDRTKSFFNYIWLNILAALKDCVL